jgi:hypothetical protein
MCASKVEALTVAVSKAEILTLGVTEAVGLGDLLRVAVCGSVAVALGNPAKPPQVGSSEAMSNEIPVEV